MNVADDKQSVQFNACFFKKFGMDCDVRAYRQSAAVRLQVAVGQARGRMPIPLKVKQVKQPSPSL
jgi:hypothetical protein